MGYIISFSQSKSNYSASTKYKTLPRMQGEKQMKLGCTWSSPYTGSDTQVHK